MVRFVTLEPKGYDSIVLLVKYEKMPRSALIVA